MNIIVDINHPAHVHFFKYFIREMKKLGNRILVTASGRSIVFELLDYYGIDYVNMGYYGNSLVDKGLNVPLMDFKMLKVALRFKPNIFMGVGSIRAAHISKMLEKISITFEDTEHSREQYILYAPFTDIIFTPDNFMLDLGPKQIRYRGDQKIAYLHPKWFEPNPRVLDDLGLKEGEPFSVLRFISWSATHDFHQLGIVNKEKFVNTLRKYIRVYISTEGILPPSLEMYRLRCHPSLIHDFLYYSSLYIGEGASMATEAALLGTPAIYVSSLAHTMGNLEELEIRYGLLFNCVDDDAALKLAIKLVSENNVKKEWTKKRGLLLKEKIDVTKFMIELIQDYPNSIVKLKNTKKNF
jgi:predicted glycosyltransferase